MRRRGFTWIYMVLCCLLPGARPASAAGFARPAYEVRPLVLPLDGLDQTLAIAINDRGQILGSYQEGTSESVFLYDKHGLTSIPISDQSITGIDNRGRIVGWTYLYDDGGFTPIAFPGANYSVALGINDRGQVVGFYSTDLGVTLHGFLYEHGEFTAIDVPGATLTSLRAINNHGLILGYYRIEGEFEVNHWFLDDHGTFSPIELSGLSQAVLQGLNDRGQIVGTYLGDTGVHGFLYDGGEIIDIDVPGADYSEALGINNRGDIVGIYFPPGDNSSGLASFVASPTHGRHRGGRPQPIGGSASGPAASHGFQGAGVP